MILTLSDLLALFVVVLAADLVSGVLLQVVVSKYFMPDMDDMGALVEDAGAEGVSERVPDTNPSVGDMSVDSPVGPGTETGELDLTDPAADSDDG